MFLGSLGFLLHPIPVAIPCMHPSSQLRQQTAERRTRIVLQRSRVLLQHGLVLRLLGLAELATLAGVASEVQTVHFLLVSFFH